MSETRIFETLLSCFASKANASKLNKFIFVFLKFATEFAAEMSLALKTNCYFFPNSIIIEMNYLAPRFRGCLQYFWLHRIYRLIYGTGAM